MTEPNIELTEQHVRSCSECPMYAGGDCHHPEADGHVVWGQFAHADVTDWCPLRARPLLVRLVVKP